MVAIGMIGMHRFMMMIFGLLSMENYRLCVYFTEIVSELPTLLQTKFVVLVEEIQLCCQRSRKGPASATGSGWIPISILHVITLILITMFITMIKKSRMIFVL